jgi:hypothetical protein
MLDTIMTSTRVSTILAPTTAAHRIFDDCSNHDNNGSVVSTIAVSGRRRTVSIRHRQGRQQQHLALLMKIAVVLFLLLMSTFTIVVAAATPTMTTTTTTTTTNTAKTGPSPHNINQLLSDRTRTRTQQLQHSRCTSPGGWKHHVATSSMKLQSHSRQVRRRQHQRSIQRSIQLCSSTTAAAAAAAVGGSSHSCSRLIKRPTTTTKALTFRQMEFLQYVCVLCFVVLFLFVWYYKCCCTDHTFHSCLLLRCLLLFCRISLRVEFIKYIYLYDIHLCMYCEHNTKIITDSFRVVLRGPSLHV